MGICAPSRGCMLPSHCLFLARAIRDVDSFFGAGSRAMHSSIVQKPEHRNVMNGTGGRMLGSKIWGAQVQPAISTCIQMMCNNRHSANMHSPSGPDDLNVSQEMCMHAVCGMCLLSHHHVQPLCMSRLHHIFASINSI